MSNQNMEVKPNFEIPFTQVSNDVIDAEDFEKPIDKLVYISLLRFAFHKGHAYPSIKRLAKMTCVTKNTLLKSLKRLEDRKLIFIKKRVENNVHKSNIYYINPYEPNENNGSEGVVQKMNHPSAKNEPPLVQKLNHPSAKIEPEEEELNNKTMNNKTMNNSLSIQDVENADLPLPIKKTLKINIDRLIEDNIDLTDIKDSYELNNHYVDDIQFGIILNNVLVATKGKIQNIKNVLHTSIQNDKQKIHKEEKVEPQSNEVLPKWFIEQQAEKKRKQRQELEDFQKEFREFREFR